jgi:hypothetical protein
MLSAFFGANPMRAPPDRIKEEGIIARRVADILP